MNGFAAVVQARPMAENEAMPFSFLARETGRVHVCGHRGYSLCYPENTMPAFAAAKACGATTVESDIALTADVEPIVLHDRTLDRTTDGHGFAADFTLEQICGSRQALTATVFSDAIRLMRIATTPAKAARAPPRAGLSSRSPRQDDMAQEADQCPSGGGP
jgi:glycerophosphoryl diester phosphodiesterase family protein